MSKTCKIKDDYTYKSIYEFMSGLKMIILIEFDLSKKSNSLWKPNNNNNSITIIIIVISVIFVSPPRGMGSIDESMIKALIRVAHRKRFVMEASSSIQHIH